MPWKNPEDRKAYRRRWYLANREKHLANVKTYKLSHPVITQKVWRKFKYGLNDEDYKVLIAEQDNRCAICGVSFEVSKQCVDHDHETGKVRGILCHDCNLGLGRFKDSIELLEKAIEYLGKV